MEMWTGNFLSVRISVHRAGKFQPDKNYDLPRSVLVFNFG